MDFGLLRVGGVTRGLARLWRSYRVFAALLLASLPCSAQEATPSEGQQALPGIVRVGVPTPTTAPVSAVAGVGYGWLDSTPAIDGGHRLHSQLGVAYTALPSLSLGAQVSGVWDSYADIDGESTKLYGEPRLAARYIHAATQALHLGAQLDARLVGAEAPSIELSATSPTLRALLGSHLAPGTWLGAELGFALDRSAQAIPQPEVLSAADRRTLGASNSNAILWGIGASHRLRSGTELLGELSGALLVGEDAPPTFQSPGRFTLGARHPLTRALALLASADLSLSARPGDYSGATLIPVEPRVGAGVTLIWRFGMPAEQEPVAPLPPAAPPPEPVAPPEPEPPAIVTSSVRGTVVDEGGRPLPDVEITMTRADAEPVTIRSFADGAFEFPEVPEGPVVVQAKTPGFEDVSVEYPQGVERQREIVMRPAVPAGQVQGKVLDLQGNAIGATITIIPSGTVIAAQADGSFELELAPGSYTVKFEHDEYTTQLRRIKVVDRGVVILNIALTR